MVAAPVVAAGIGAAADLAGGLVGQYYQNKATDKSYKFQKKVLQNQVQWRVADAVKAGLHPLAALGMSPAAGPGVSIGGSPLGEALSSMGQNVSRAAEATLTPADKVGQRVGELALERAGLENELLRTQIASQRIRNLTEGTPGRPAIIDPPGKGDRLGGASAVGRDRSGQAFIDLPGWSAEKYEESMGEVIAEAQGLDRAAATLGYSVKVHPAPSGPISKEMQYFRRRY